MRRLRCPRCGLTYCGATLPQYLLCASGASCPRCAAALFEASPEPDDRHHATALAWPAAIEAVAGELPPAPDAKRRAWAASARAVAEDG